MKMWIARDKSGAVYLYKDKPSLQLSGQTFDTDSPEVIRSGDYSFTEVTFENSPMEVELIIKK